MHHLHLHFFPILVSAVIQWMIGALWYSPVLFAKPWMALLHIDPDREKKGLAGGMIASFAGSLLLSLVLAHVIFWAGAQTAPWGMFVGFLLWVGFIAAPSYAQGIYEGRPAMLFAINTGYWLVALLVTGGMLAVWH